MACSWIWCNTLVLKGNVLHTAYSSVPWTLVEGRYLPVWIVGGRWLRRTLHFAQQVSPLQAGISQGELHLLSPPSCSCPSYICTLVVFQFERKGSLRTKCRLAIAGSAKVSCIYFLHPRGFLIAWEDMSYLIHEIPVSYMRQSHGISMQILSPASSASSCCCHIFDVLRFPNWD